ncbi:threonine/serine exporter family protein, partial [Citrobacter braakii]|uniref:threonine/serine exporter family protein n=1 Tax=Citrobacter braakii TaxID=57706 RepID=UPI00374F45A0
LVPGFPLINSVADMFKGHINTGLARWAIASLLTLATCIGVVMAMVGVWLNVGNVSSRPEIEVATNAVMQKLICGCKCRDARIW